MKILITSHAFHPAIGGIETMTMLLAQGFARQGHEVVVTTSTPNPDADDFPFKVLRNPAKREFLETVRWCDVFFQNNISLKTLWPLLFVRKPWVVAHHTWIRRIDGSLGWQDRFKRLLLRFSSGISISRAMAEDISVSSVIIGNPYRDDLFRILPEVEKDRDIVFLGRLVSDKGPGLLLHALSNLRGKELTPTVTFIGAGPELESLQRQVADGGLERQVQFVGQKSGEELVRLLNRHRIMAVPSVWNEPFGIVALEGIACGCAVVGSEGGGLKDAIGPCGVTFRNGDVEGLGATLERLLQSPDAIRECLQHAPVHLSRHTLQSVTDRYLKVLEASLVSR